MSFLEQLKRIVIVTGHYGSGKTNLALNLALDLQAMGRPVTMVDLDIVNPYFRSSDFTQLLRQKGIETAFSPLANSTLDVPALSPLVDAAIRQRERQLVIDVGGDDAGATALGRYAAQIAAEPYTMLYVVNRNRYLTREPQEALEILGEVQQAARLQATHIVNNTHLGGETTAQDILAGLPYGEEVSRAAGLPLLCATAPRTIAHEWPKTVYPVDILVKTSWQ